MAESLGKRLFNRRLDLIAEIDTREPAEAGLQIAEPRGQPYQHPETDAEVRAKGAALLHKEVAAMNLDNFVVRPHRRAVEKYAQLE